MIIPVADTSSTLDEDVPDYPLDPEGRVRGKKGSVDSTSDDKPSPTRPPKSQSQPPVVKYATIEDTLKTGDLVLLYRHDCDQPNFGIFLTNSSIDPDFPVLLIKTKTKPLSMDAFNQSCRDIKVITAVTRIFYGDYRKVSIRRLSGPPLDVDGSHVMRTIKKVNRMEYTPQELMLIHEAATPILRSIYVASFTLSHVYKELGALDVLPADVRPETFQDALMLAPPVDIKLPSYKIGPMVEGTPPFLSKLVDGIKMPPEYPMKSYGNISSTLQTGDIVLFSGASSTGSLIKIFDGALFSHVGLVLRVDFSDDVMLWESTTNTAGLVDIHSGSIIRKGVMVIPLTSKIFSGWYNRVAVRRLTGIDNEKRIEIYKRMLQLRKELQGRPYEKNHLELLMSGVKFTDEYLSFLLNRQEDLSSIFCSELVAHVYQELGLIGKERYSNQYTPDDFTSHRNFTVNYGTLEKEEYIDIQFDYQQ